MAYSKHLVVGFLPVMDLDRVFSESEESIVTLLREERVTGLTESLVSLKILDDSESCFFRDRVKCLDVSLVSLSVLEAESCFLRR